jgi:hypothetical protein
VHLHYASLDEATSRGGSKGPELFEVQRFSARQARQAVDTEERANYDSPPLRFAIR